jgi:transcriptional regulator with XRE-family HTH domain
MDTERILTARVGKALRTLREARGLKPATLARESLVHRSQLSRYEAGELSPPLPVLQAILKKLNTDETAFLSRLGLTPEEYETLRSKKYLHQDIAAQLSVPATSINEINR